MSTQTLLNIGLSMITVYLAIRNFVLTSRKESQRESAEMAEIRTQLSQVMGMLRDMQKDIRTSTADFRELNGRVIIIETRLTEAFERLKKMEESYGK